MWRERIEMQVEDYLAKILESTAASKELKESNMKLTKDLAHAVKQHDEIKELLGTKLGEAEREKEQAITERDQALGDWQKDAATLRQKVKNAEIELHAVVKKLNAEKGST
jgi:hypothetical protein